MASIADLKSGQRAKIEDVSTEQIPLKLLEMGCLPGNTVEVVSISEFKDPMYLNINDTFLAIRRDIAQLVIVEQIEATL